MVGETSIQFSSAPADRPHAPAAAIDTHSPSSIPYPHTNHGGCCLWPCFRRHSFRRAAFLLFLVQPMVGKMVLPLLGGTPAVWSTCMVFFQALLLVGYTYAHSAPKRLGLLRQSWLHLVVLAMPLLAMGAMVVVTSAPVGAIRARPPGVGVSILWDCHFCCW